MSTSSLPYELSPVRVLLVSTSFPRYPGDSSGPFVARLAEALGASIDVSVLVPDSRVKADFLANTRYQVRSYQYAPRSWQRLAHEPGGIPVALRKHPQLWVLLPIFLLAMFIAVLRAGRSADIIHANWAMTGLICGLAGKLLRKPVVTTLRGSDVSRLDRSRLNRLVLGIVLRLNVRVIAVSISMQHALRQLFPHRAAGITHIPNGVDQQLLSLKLPAPSKGALRLVSIGNLILGKGNAAIIQALRTLPNTVMLTLIGEGPEYKQLVQQARALRVEERVHFKGVVPPHAIPDMLAQHDVLILASFSEGRPNVVVEAMAAGRAVLASRLPGTQELIEHGHNGLLFEPGDPAAIVQSIGLLLEDPREVIKLGRSARQTILDLGISWPDCARQYREIYREVLERSD